MAPPGPLAVLLTALVAYRDDLYDYADPETRDRLLEAADEAEAWLYDLDAVIADAGPPLPYVSPDRRKVVPVSPEAA